MKSLLDNMKESVKKWKQISKESIDDELSVKDPSEEYLLLFKNLGCLLGTCNKKYKDFLNDFKGLAQDVTLLNLENIPLDVFLDIRENLHIIQET